MCCSTQAHHPSHTEHASNNAVASRLRCLSGTRPAKARDRLEFSNDKWARLRRAVHTHRKNCHTSFVQLTATALLIFRLCSISQNKAVSPMLNILHGSYFRVILCHTSSIHLLALSKSTACFSGDGTLILKPLLPSAAFNTSCNVQNAGSLALSVAAWGH